VKLPQSEATALRLVYVHILRGSNSKGVNTEPQAGMQFLGATKFHGRKEEKWRTREGAKKIEKAWNEAIKIKNVLTYYH